MVPIIPSEPAGDSGQGEYLFCGADLGRDEFPFTCYRRVAHDGPCSPRMDEEAAR